MNKFFEKDVVLRILSVVLAIIVWFYISIVLNPEIETTISNVPVQFVEQAKLSEAGLSIVNEQTPTVDVKIRGSRSAVYNVNIDNITATVNLSSINKKGVHTIPINVSLSREEIAIVERKPQSVDINVDKIISSRKNIEVWFDGELKEGFIAGDLKITPSSVAIKGTSSSVGEIEKAIVKINRSGRDLDIQERPKVILIDSQGNEVNESYTISKDVEEVDVFCPVYQLKNVAIKPNIVGQIPETAPYTLGEVTVSPDYITIYSKPEIISEIEEILTTPILISTITKNTEEKVLIKIPENVVIRDDIREVNVTIKLNPKQ